MPDTLDKTLDAVWMTRDDVPSLYGSGDKIYRLNECNIVSENIIPAPLIH